MKTPSRQRFGFAGRFYGNGHCLYVLSLLLFADAGIAASGLQLVGQDGPSVNSRFMDGMGTGYWRIEASGDLVSWESFGEVAVLNSYVTFSGEQPLEDRHRFYRSVLLANGFQAALDQNRAKWESAAVPAYRFTFIRYCFCIPEEIQPFIITVRDGTITHVQRAADRGELSPSSFNRYPTIDGLFDLLLDALDRSAFRVTARFHANYGFSMSGYMDLAEFLADEELDFRVSQFEVIEPILGVGMTDRLPIHP